MPAVIQFGINFSWRLLSRKIEVQMYATVMLLTVLYVWNLVCRTQEGASADGAVGDGVRRGLWN